MTTRAADGLDGFLTQVGERLAEADVAGFDETGLRVAGTVSPAAAAYSRSAAVCDPIVSSFFCRTDYTRVLHVLADPPQPLAGRGVEPGVHEGYGPVLYVGAEQFN